MIYVASPYTHLRDDIMEARFNINEACTAFWLRQGLSVFSPIVHCRQIAIKYELPHDFDYWQRMNFAWINAARAMWVLQFPNWEISKGVSYEITQAKKVSRIDISFFTWEEIKNISLVPTWNKVVEDSIQLLETL